MASSFPDRLIACLRRRTGARASFDRATGMAPVARHSRLVFCPPELDFERSADKGLIRCGHCVDLERDEPRFEWSRVPAGRKLIYCSLGTQSLRNPRAGRVLSRMLEAVNRRDDWFLVIACHPTQAAALPTDVDNALVVHQAPQLAMLRRASAFVTHAGFNGLKEAVACGVPMVAVPLSHDQPRNAALIVHRALGVTLDASTLTAAAVASAVEHVMGDASIRAACRRLRRTFREASGYDRALNAIDALMAEGPSRQRSSGAIGCPNLPGREKRGELARRQEEENDCDKRISLCEAAAPHAQWGRCAASNPV